MCALLALLAIIGGTLLHDVVEFVGYITKLLHGLLGCGERRSEGSKKWRK